MCCILCVCIYVITLYCIYGMFLIDYGTPVLFKSLFLKLFIKALLSRLLDTSAIEIYYYYYNVSVYQCVRVSVCSCISMYVYSCVCVSVCPCIGSSVYLSISVSVHQCVHASVN